MIVICYPQMEILLIKESRHRLVPGIFMINFLIGVIRLPALCRSGISFIIASLHFEELTIAIATSLQVRRILFNLLPPATKLGQGYFFTGVCDSVYGGEYLGRYAPRDQVQPPRPGTPSQRQCMPGDTGNKRAVRILLECILVSICM